VAEAFAAHPEWDALFGDIVYVDGRGREIYRREEAKYDYGVLLYSGICYVNHQTLFVRRDLHDRLGFYRHKDFKNCCDWDFVLRMGQAGCCVGHVNSFLIDYRYHDFGQSADLRITTNMERESAIIRKAHGVPNGWRGRVLQSLFRAKRQWQKLIYRGKIDLVPGTWKLRRHMRARTQFQSNVDFN